MRSWFSVEFSVHVLRDLGASINADQFSKLIHFLLTFNRLKFLATHQKFTNSHNFAICRAKYVMTKNNNFQEVFIAIICSIVSFLRHCFSYRYILLFPYHLTAISFQTIS